MSASPRPLSVLVVDDDDLVSAFVALQVAAMGCDVATASDGVEALARLDGTPVDVLITDWQMPGVDGIELVRRLRATATERYLHIVMMTTKEAGRTVRQALAVEVDDFLFKPVDPVRLELAIATARRVVGLQRRLARRNHHLAAANTRTRDAYRRIRSDLDAAAATQRALLPPWRLGGALRHAWLFIPATGIGGDTLNVCPGGDGPTFFFQLDVCGHGIPAALRSFSLHHRLSARPPRDVPTLQAMLAALNRDAQSDTADSYYTLSCGLIEPTGRVSLIRAGHPMALLIQGGQCHPLPAGNLPIGLLPGQRYEATSLDLAPGDRLIVHSDGVSECTDRLGEELGTERLQAFFTDHADLPLDVAVARFEDRLRRFRGTVGFDDDVSLLIIERAGEEP